MTFLDALVLWVHIVAAVVFVGPQVFLVMIAMPAIRTISDLQVRRDITRKITLGFGSVGGAALGVLLLTGIWNFIRIAQGGEGVTRWDIKRYFIALQIKLTLVVVVVALTAVHGAVFGRRLQALQDSGAPEAEIERVRQQSMLLSIANLAVSILILLCAAILASGWGQSGELR